MRRALVLVEGPTEERFVKDVLRPCFWPIGMDLAPTLLVTKRVKNGPDFKGGVSTFARFKGDLKRLLHDAGDALVTTLLDYDGLPPDFPGMGTRPPGGPMDRVTHVEQAIWSYFDSPPALVPYLSLHEFEALLFSSDEELPGAMGQRERQGDFCSIRAAYETPEHIDEDKWPSRRILALFHGYRKAAHGPIVACRIGLPRIRSECPHFDDWIRTLERYAGQGLARRN